MDLPTTNVLSICSGIGGLDLALRIACERVRTVCFVEREACAAATLVKLMEAKALDCAPIWDDAQSFDGKPWRGVVDIVTAGFPCQPFSTAGRQLGESDPRHLWPSIERIVGEVEAPLVFLENVPELLRLGYESVRRGLEGMGYRVEAGLFTAREVGAGHRRQRVFILAYSKSLADTNGGGREAAHVSKREGRRVADASRCGQSLAFPPGPNAIEEWRHLLNREPLLTPCAPKEAISKLCGMADGAPSARDQLRMLGNAVVPLVGAHAFAALWRSMLREEVGSKQG